MSYYSQYAIFSSFYRIVISSLLLELKNCQLWQANKLQWDP